MKDTSPVGAGTLEGASFSIFRQLGCSEELIFGLYSRLEQVWRSPIWFSADRKPPRDEFSLCEMKNPGVRVADPILDRPGATTRWILLV